LSDAESYLQVRTPPPTPVPPHCQIAPQRRKWRFDLFESQYSPYSLISSYHFESFYTSQSLNDGVAAEGDKGRKRKAPASSGAAAVVDAAMAKEDETSSGRRYSELASRLSVADSESRTHEMDIVADAGDDLAGEKEAVVEGSAPKKKRVSKVAEVAVPEGSKRKRKKSAVAQEAEEDPSPSLLLSVPVPVPDSLQSADTSSLSAPKGKRALKESKAERESSPFPLSLSLDSTAPAAKAQCSILRPAVEKLLLYQTARKRGGEVSEGMGEGEILSLPPALEALLDFWVRSLQLLDCRLEEAHTWKGRAADLMSTAGKAPPAGQRNGMLGWEERAKELLQVGIARGIKVTGREVLEMHLHRISAWCATAAAFLGQTGASIVNCLERTAIEGASTMSQQALGEFIRSGELLQVDRPSELAELKAELKKAKTWLARFSRTAPGSGASAATPNKEADEELEALTAEARHSLKVDVREELEAISQATRRYCLCRQLYHGSMVGCDECDEWYHFQCVGLTQFQVERADKYVCIRCCLKNSFSQAANLAAQISNRWSAPDEAAKAREARRGRVSHLISVSM
jgi:PHD-finger